MSNPIVTITMANGRVFDSYHCIKLHAKSLEAA